MEVGDKEVKAAELDLQSAKAEKAGRDAEGKQYKQGELERLEQEFLALRAQLEPFAAERARRESSA